MLFAHLRRGLTAGVIGGAIYGLFTLTVIVNLVTFAESFETGHHSGHEALVTETTTVIVSSGGGVLWGIFLGLLGFGGVYYFLEPALPGKGGTKSYVLGAGGFITVSGAPWLVLPPLPPGMDQTLPTNVRVLWYIVMMITGAVACGTAGYLYIHLHDRWGKALASITAGVPFFLVVGVAMIAPANLTTGNVPSRFLTAYQWIILFGQAGLWFCLATVHAWTARRIATTSGVHTSSQDVSSTADSW